MEELLNKLIEKGWKPFGKEAKEIYIDKNEITIERLNWFRVVYTTRQISSIDSWLWQFCVDNKLVKMDIWDFKRTYNFELDYIDVHQDDFQYRIIESAMKDESELEQFLLDNIKL